MVWSQRQYCRYKTAARDFWSDTATRRLSEVAQQARHEPDVMRPRDGRNQTAVSRSRARGLAVVYAGSTSTGTALDETTAAELLNTPCIKCFTLRLPSSQPCLRLCLLFFCTAADENTKVKLASVSSATVTDMHAPTLHCASSPVCLSCIFGCLPSQEALSRVRRHHIFPRHHRSSHVVQPQQPALQDAFPRFR